MADYKDILLRLAKRLYPKGRAWKIPFLGDFEKLHKGLAKSENKLVQAAMSVLDSTLPDNDNFDTADAANWERCLGLTYQPGTTLADRKAAIKTHLNHPGTIAARQTAAYIESVLRSANFDVYVYENRFLEGSPPDWVTKTPAEVLGVPAGYAALGNFELGELNLASEWVDGNITIIANHVEDDLDADFGFGDNLRSTFYIAGSAITAFADVDAVRKKEFRQLIMRLKPQQAVGVLFVNYV